MVIIYITYITYNQLTDVDKRDNSEQYRNFTTYTGGGACIFSSFNISVIDSFFLNKDNWTLKLTEI